MFRFGCENEVGDHISAAANWRRGGSHLSPHHPVREWNLDELADVREVARRQRYRRFIPPMAGEPEPKLDAFHPKARVGFSLAYWRDVRLPGRRLGSVGISRAPEIRR